MRRYITFITLVAVSLRGFLAHGHLCNVSRYSRGSAISSEKWHDAGNQVHVKVDCSSRDIVQIPTGVSNDVTELDLRGNKIDFVQENVFMNMVNLRVLILAENSIRTLQGRCFCHLSYLERLDLNDNNIDFFNSSVFVGLQSLRVLTMSGLRLTSYSTEFVAYTSELRVLSLSVIGNAPIPPEYARLPRLEVLDFSKEIVELAKFTAAMFDGIRDCNVTTLSFRNMNGLLEIEADAFSNLPNTRSLMFTCNNRMSFMKTVAALAVTTNTSVDTVVLDSARGDAMAMFDEFTFCTPFWRRVRRFSARDTRVGGFTLHEFGCLSQLRQINFDYNSLMYRTPGSSNLTAVFPRLNVLNMNHRTTTKGYFNAKCFSRDFSFDADHYFQTKPLLLTVNTSESIYETKPCNEYKSIFDLPLTLEFLSISDIGLPVAFCKNQVVCYRTGNLRHLNVSHNKKLRELCKGYRSVGLNRLETVDISFCGLDIIHDDVFRNFKNLRFLNLSHNTLDVSGSNFKKTFSYLSRLEDINLSNNKLRQINTQAFERCTRLRRLDLSNNELTDIEINICNMEVLEYIDVSGNRLVRLSDTFTAMLDQHFHVHLIELNVQREMFTCNCESVSFLRWTRVTRVRLTERDRLTCVYRHRDDTPLRQVVLEELESGCQVSFVPVVVPVVVGVAIIIFFLFLVRYHRWYIKYHLVLCWQRGGMLSSRTRERDYDAMVLYFEHAANPVDQQGGVARISRWVSVLMKHADKDWGLCLYVGDRHGVGGASKMQNFVRGFDGSDKVVVCLTRGFIDDSDCMYYLEMALNNHKPLTKYIFLLFDDIQTTSFPRRLQQLLRPDSPSNTLTWSSRENEDERDTFWRRLREALMHDPDQERCRRRFDVIPLLASIYDTRGDGVNSTTNSQPSLINHPTLPHTDVTFM